MVGVVIIAAGFFLAPMLFGNPQVVQVTPADGSENANPQAPLRIEFNQPVQPESVANAISLEPSVPLQVDIEGTTVLIQPEGGLSYGTDYRLKLAAGVENQFGRTLEQPFELAFTTTPYVTVASTAPPQTTDNVDLATPIRVIFESPIVSEQAIEQAAQNPHHADNMPQPLTLTTDTVGTVTGTGRWLSPTLFSLYPDGGLEPGTTYTATVGPEVSADGQARMEEPFEWQFTTTSIVPVSVRPYDGATEVAPDQPLELHMQRNITIAVDNAFFTLRDTESNTQVSGRLRQADEGQLLFQPDTPLQRGTRYEATLADTLNTTSGATVTPEPRTWHFTTMGDLSVVQVAPAEGAIEVLTDTNRISVHFNHPVVALTTVDKQESLPHPLTITPPVEGNGSWLDTRTYSYEPADGLAPSTTYQVRVDAELTDQGGSPLSQEYTWSFTTIMPTLLETVPSEGEQHASPFTDIKLHFNQPMDAASLRSATRLQHADSGTRIPASISVAGSTATITPNEPLERGNSYLVAVEAGAQAAQGNATLQQSFFLSFRVSPLPRIIETRPFDGDTSANTSSSIMLTFSAPMEWDTVEQHLSIEPALTDIYTSTDRLSYSIYASLEPETDYSITVGAAARDIYGVEMGQDQTINFRTAPLRPSLSFIGAYSIGNYNANNPVRVPMRHTNVSEVTYTIYRLDPMQGVQLLSDHSLWDTMQPGRDQVFRSETVPLHSQRNQSDITFVEPGTMEPGLYYIEVRDVSPENSIYGEENRAMVRQFMAVSPYAMTIKQSDDELFLWLTDLEQAQPVSDLPLTAAYAIFSDEGESTIQQVELGTSDQEGILKATFSPEDTFASFFIWSPESDRFVFATQNWSDGISPWSFGLPASIERHPLEGNVYTDRPIYRPGHTVHLRGAVRKIQDEHYTIPDQDQQLNMIIRDPEWNTMFDTMLELNEFGTFHTSIGLDTTVPPGEYNIIISDPGTGTESNDFIYGTFMVAEYRTPSFEVTVEPGTTDLVQDKPLDMHVTASYFSGGAVANAPVRWRLLATPYTFSSESAPRFRFEDLDDAYEWYLQHSETFSGGDLVSDGTAQTNAQGEVTLTFPTELEDNQSQQFTLDVEVTDIDGQVIASRGTATIHAGAVYVGLHTDGYVTEVGTPQQVSLLTVDIHGDEVGNQDVDVDIYRREWFTVREQGSDGQMYWTTTYSDTLVETQSPTTDGQGRADISFTPDQGGSYRIAASTTDDNGHTVQASAFTWAYGGNTFWGINDNNRIELVADKDSYAPGETASIMIPAPYENMTALMTIERASVLEHRIFTIQGSTDMLQVPITADYAPNIYVSVVLIKPATIDVPTPDVRVGMINLSVSTEQQELTIDLTPDKEEYGPREDVTYTIKATDHSGKGVQTEFSLALVDKAVLSLTDDKNQTFKQAFYTSRPLGIFTAQSITALVDRITADLEAEGKGGGGGPAEEVMVRRDFPATAYWNPTLVTDADGTAQVTLTLPDNLTTWRMTAQGITRDTLVGIQNSELLSTRPLIIRPTLPRFLTVGDSPEIQAVIHNNTSEAVEASVTLEVSNLNIDTPAEQTIQVAASDQQLVSWQAHAPHAGEATLRLSVSGNSMQDVIEQTIPIQRFKTPEVVATAGQVYDTPVVETIAFALPDKDQPGDMGEINLEMVPSLVAGIETGLDYLETYPYACTEQTVSRFMPNAVTYRIFKDFGIKDDELKANLERTLSQSLQRLYQTQQPDGGWGWWETDTSNPYLTAYVVQGLVEAGKAGYGINQDVLDRALGYLEETLNAQQATASSTGTGTDTTTDTGQAAPTPPISDHARAYILFVMAEAGEPDRGRTIALYDRRDQEGGLAIYARAYLLMTLQHLDGEEDRVQTLVDEFTSTALVQTTSAHWEEEHTDYWSMSSDTRTTALALQALVRSDPDNFLVPNAVRYLMSLRDEGHWRTTLENATTLMALIEYVAESGELEADYTYRATLDEQRLSEGDINRDNLDDPISAVVSLADMLANQQAPDENEQHTSTLTIEKEGTGRLYYTLRMRYFKDAEEVEALDRGIGIEREYIAVEQDTLQPTGALVSQVQTSDVVQVRLTLTVPENVHYLTVEDMLPAGLEALDTSLKTVTDMAEEAELESTDDERPSWWYFTQTSIHDNRVAMFATHLPRGTYHYTYLARAVTPGTFQTLPATAYQMYAPEVFGRSKGTSFVVTR
jgi:hypothetical protein